LNKEGTKENWDEIIRPKRGLFDIRLNEIWEYRDLLFQLVRRDYVSVYKQTLLGPLWYLIQSFFTAFAFTVVFVKIANLPTEHIPPMLFFMGGTVCWNYFSQCLTKTSNTFVGNAGIFGKVYFPRLVVPIATVLSSLIGFAIQFLFFMAFIVFYSFRGVNFNFNDALLLLPVLILMMAMLGVGFGIIISSLTVKYRDFQYLITFGVQLLMYATPVIYPLSWIKGGLRNVMLLNPLTSIVETFRYSFLGTGELNWYHLGYTALFSVVIFFIGIILFNRVERNFMDTV
jgi:lipopolysaccharide transport system permease protein